MSDEKESAVSLVRKCLNELGEHYDTVQIFATRHEAGKDGTVNVQLGVGNWFARYGQIITWVVKADETHRIDAQKDETE